MCGRKRDKERETEEEMCAEIGLAAVSYSVARRVCFAAKLSVLLPTL